MNISKGKQLLRQRPIKRVSSNPDYTLKGSVQEYLVNSTFHGLNYVGDKELSIFERLFFLLAFVLVTLLSAYYISIMWLKFTATPGVLQFLIQGVLFRVIVSISSTVTKITDIPFPAITICNMNQASKAIAKNFKPNSYEEMQLKRHCMSEEDITENRNFTSNWKQYKKFLSEVSQPCSEMLVMCSFGKKPLDCLQIFQTVLTDDGLCCTFNQVHPKFLQQNYRAEEELELFRKSDLQQVDWNPETRYGATIITNKIYPLVAVGPGSALGLTLILYSNYNDYYCSSTNSEGFKLLLHNPIDMPMIENFGFAIRTGHHSRLAITTNIPSASPLIRSISRSKRQCEFTGDSNLTYFRYYSKKNCELECKSRTIQKVCGCVQYYLPKLDRKTKICSQDEAHCYKKIQLAIESSYNDTFVCKCLPGCFNMFYNGEISMNKFDVEGLIREPEIKKFNSSFLRKNIAMVNIYYDDAIVRKNIKNVFVGFTEFLSGTGGLLSLFMGFSALSIVEIFYYASVRPFCLNKKFTGQLNEQVTIGEPKEVWKKILKN